MLQLFFWGLPGVGSQGWVVLAGAILLRGLLTDSKAIIHMMHGGNLLVPLMTLLFAGRRENKQPAKA